MIENVAFVLFLLVRLCSLLLILGIIGNVVRLLSQKTRWVPPFTSDLGQTVAMNMALGCLTLYLIALILTPLHWFNHGTVIAIVTGFPIIQLWLWRNDFMHAFSNRTIISSLKGALKTHQIRLVVVLLAIFLVSLTFQIIPVHSFVLGSVHDAALHSLLTQLLIEDHGFPTTHEPYLPFIVKIPLGTHTIFAFASLLFAIPPEKAVFQLTPMFAALVILGAYYLGKSISSTKFGIALALIIGFVAQYPMGITWGGNTLSLGLFLYLLLVGAFIQCFLTEDVLATRRKLGIMVVLGLLLGYLGTVHITICLLTIITLILIDIAAIAWNKTRRVRTIHHLFQLQLIMGIAGLIPLLIWIYRFLFLPNITLEPVDYSSIWPAEWYRTGYEWGRLFPANVLFNPLKHWQICRIWWDWHMNAGWIGAKLLLPLSASLPILTFLGYLLKRDNRLLRLTILCFIPYLATLVISQSTPYGIFNATAGEYTQIIGEADKLIIWLTVSLSILATASIVYLDMIIALLLKVIRKVPSKAWGRLAYAPLYALAIASLTFIPSNVGHLRGDYSYVCLTTENDYTLMIWMRDNLQETATVFTGECDAGSYIPTVCHLKAIYPYSGSPLSRDICPNYATLCSILEQGDMENPLLETLLQELHVDFIFIGEYVFEGYTRIDPANLLSRPDLFEPTQQFGNAYLFACRKTTL